MTLDQLNRLDRRLLRGRVAFRLLRLGWTLEEAARSFSLSPGNLAIAVRDATGWKVPR